MPDPDDLAPLVPAAEEAIEQQQRAGGLDALGGLVEATGAAAEAAGAVAGAAGDAVGAVGGVLNGLGTAAGCLDGCSCLVVCGALVLSAGGALAFVIR